MCRLNSYLLCADTSYTDIFVKSQYLPNFPTDRLLFPYWLLLQLHLRGLISAHMLIKSHVYMHRQTQTWWHIQISGDLQNLLKSQMHAIGWRATLYSMLYIRHPLWVRLLTIQPLCVPGTCRGFSFMSDLFHVRFIYLNGGILELLRTAMRGIEIIDFTTTKFLMSCKRNYLLQQCNVFLIWIHLLMENLILCSLISNI